MAPTRDHEEIEGRYKEYAYSPVPASSTSAVFDSTALGKYPREIGAGSPEYRINGVHEKCRVAEMTEKGSTRLQYIAAAAGKLQPLSLTGPRGLQGGSPSERASALDFRENGTGYLLLALVRIFARSHATLQRAGVVESVVKIRPWNPHLRTFILFFFNLLGN